MSVFNLEKHGFTETLEWNERFAAWYLTLQHTDGWKYERLIEDDPHTWPDSLKDFYRDDALAAHERESK